MISLGIQLLLLSTANAFLFGLPFGQNFGSSFGHGHDFPAVPSFDNQHGGAPFEPKLQAPFNFHFDGSFSHGFPPNFDRPSEPWDLSFAGSNWPHRNGWDSMTQPVPWTFMDNSNQHHQGFPKFEDHWMVPFDQPSQINQFHTLNTHHYAWDQNHLGDLVEAKKNKSIKHESTYDPNLHGDEKGTWKTTGNEEISALSHKRQHFLLPEKHFRFSQPKGKMSNLKFDHIDLRFDDSNLHKGFEKNQLDESEFWGPEKKSTFTADSDVHFSHSSRQPVIRDVFYRNNGKKMNNFATQKRFVNFGGKKQVNRNKRVPGLHNRRFRGAKEMDEYEIIEERPFYSDELQPKINKYNSVNAPRSGKPIRKRKRRYISL